MLHIRNVTKRFGGIVAVDNLTLAMEEGIVLGLIGPNGAGKTTTVNMITGLEKPDEGEIWYKNKKISGMPPHKIAQMGIVRTYQITKVFRDMSTLENLYVPVVWQRHTLSSPEVRARELLESFDPFYGIHPRLKKQFSDYLKKLNKEGGLSILMISHDIPTIMDICDRIAVMSSGVLIAEGPPSQIRKDDRVVEAYLGG
jgi:branched-chain amino acid transport system ATP-binding protein